MNISRSAIDYVVDGSEYANSTAEYAMLGGTEAVGVAGAYK
jgi:hypothetical protein